MLSGGIGASDFGESFRFQKVLQGQEISSFDNPFDGSGTQNPHPSETRRGYPGGYSSGTASMGNNLRDNFTPNGIGFGESFRFRKVLQGQEIHPSSSCGRAQTNNDNHDYGSLGIFDRVQVPSSRNGWPALMQQGNSSHIHSSGQSMQASSPSSVLMFQHAMNPVSKFGSVHNNHNQEEHRIPKRSSYATESNGGEKLIPFSFISEDRGGSRPSHCSNGRVRNDMLCPLTAQPSCKSSCRLFGFSLTEEKQLPRDEKRPSPITSSLNPGVSSFPGVGPQFHANPPLMTKAVGSNCTKVSNLYSSYDICF